MMQQYCRMASGAGIQLPHQAVQPLTKTGTKIMTRALFEREFVIGLILLIVLLSYLIVLQCHTRNKEQSDDLRLAECAQTSLLRYASPDV